MRLLKSTPKDREFYNEHGGNLSAYYTIANLGQSLSAGSLAIAVFSILTDAVRGQGISVASGVIIAVAAAVGLFIELANRKLSRPAIRPLVVKDQFADDEEKRRRHRLLTKVSRGGLFLVGALSLWLSWKGSIDAGKMIVDDPPAANVDSLNTAAAARLATLTTAFSTDTTALLSPYQVRSSAARSAFDATRAERKKKSQDFTGCARRGNKWCKQQQRAIMGDIDAARAELAVTLAEIAAERGQALAAALARRDAAAADATGRSDAALTKAEASATAAAEEASTKASTTGYIFAVLTFVGQIVFYLMMYLILQIEAGSEIDEELQPNEFHDQPSVLADLRAVISHRVERGARRLIRKVFGDRDRLTDGLPYIHLWDAPPPTTDDPAAVASASADTTHAPGFYRAAEDPHTGTKTPTSRALYSTPATPKHTAPKHTKATHETPESREAKQRLKQYKKRLGEHTQKARVQQKKNGEITSRTAEAIANNRQWVEHYTNLLNDLNEG